MIIEREIPPWLDWLLGTGSAQGSALLHWLAVVGLTFLLGLALAVLIGIGHQGRCGDCGAPSGVLGKGCWTWCGSPPAARWP